jgi:hypothetical protein
MAISRKARVDTTRDLIEEIEPSSILPSTSLIPETVGAIAKLVPQGNALSALFSARELVIFEGDRVPAWWSPWRDRWLWQRMVGSDVLSSAIFSTSARLSSVPINVVPNDPTNRMHRRLSQWSDMLLKHYWSQIAFQAAVEWQTQDNGCFVEIMGAGDPGGPIEPTKIPGTQDYIFATGLRILDSQSVQRTGDDTYPILYRYRPIGGVEKLYKFHKTRVVAISQMPSTRSGMFGVGLSGASRAIRSILQLDDVDMLQQEIMGSRPISQLVFSRGISAEAIRDAFIKADERALEEARLASSERKRTARSVFVSAEGPADQVRAASVEMLDLKRLPESYDPKVNMELAINVVSMALGFDPRELWPGTATGATRADAEVQQQKSMVKTPGIWMNTWRTELNQKWCPWPCSITFDEQDDAQDMLRAEIHKIHADTIAQYMASGSIDFETAWQMMMENGDISERQYLALQVSEEFALKAEVARVQAEQARVELENAKKPAPEPAPKPAASGSE